MCQYHRQFVYENITYYTFINRVLDLVVKIRTCSLASDHIAIYLPNCYNYIEILLASLISGRNIEHWNHDTLKSDSAVLVFTNQKYRRYFSLTTKIIIIDEQIKNIPFQQGLVEDKLEKLELLGKLLNTTVQLFTVDSKVITYSHHHIKYFLKHIASKNQDTLVSIPLHHPLGSLWSLQVIFSGKRLDFGTNIRNNPSKQVICVYPYTKIFTQMNVTIICYIPLLQKYSLQNSHKVTYRYFYYPLGLELFYNISFKKSSVSQLENEPLLTFTTDLPNSITYYSTKKFKIKPELVEYLSYPSNKISITNLKIKKKLTRFEITYTSPDVLLTTPPIQPPIQTPIHETLEAVESTYYNLSLYIYNKLMTHDEMRTVYKQALFLFPQLKLSWEDGKQVQDTQEAQETGQPLFLEEGKLMKDLVFELLSKPQKAVFYLVLQRTNNISKNRISLILSPTINHLPQILQYFNESFTLNRQIEETIVYHNKIDPARQYIRTYISYILHIIVNLYYQVCNKILSLTHLTHLTETTAYFYNKIIPEPILQSLPQKNVKSFLLFTLLKSIKKYCPEILVYNLDTNTILPLPLLDNSWLTASYLDFYSSLNSPIPILQNFSQQFENKMSDTILYISTDYSDNQDYYSYTFGNKGLSYINLSLHKKSLYISIFIHNLGYKIILKEVVDDFVAQIYTTTSLT